MQRVNGFCRMLDFRLAGFRYDFLRASGVVGAAALATTLSHWAARAFDDPVAVTEALLPIAFDDLRQAPPPRILVKSYTMCDALECAQPSSACSEQAARLADAMMTSLEDAKPVRSSIVDHMVLRRLLASALLAIPAQSILDCVRSLDPRESRKSERIVVLIPSPRDQGQDIELQLNRFWREVAQAPWSRDSYAALTASAMATAQRRLGLEAGEIARGIARSKGRGEMAAAWHAMGAGRPDGVHGIVSLVRRLSDIMIDHALASEGEVGATLGAVAGLLCPVSKASFARQFLRLSEAWSADLPARLEGGRLVLVMGDAPAVVV